ncbi:MAG: factor H binding family protein [Cardiobacteriaceae bacterium]|nr:factor H binding family protein [Cardiobacteriaceae bacterium]
MQPVFMNLTLAFIAGFCATACRNDDALTLVDAPKDPIPGEKAEFQASKVDQQEPETPYGEIEPDQITANGTTLVSTVREGGKWISRQDYRSLQPGMATLHGHLVLTNSGQSFPETIRSHQGLRGGIIVTYNPENGKYSYADTYGVEPPLASFPEVGQATYRSVAFDMKEQGTLTYHVDFAAKSGHGEITGLSRYGTITLANAPLKVETHSGKSSYVGRGTASSAKGGSFDYQVDFYGQQAEEIAGFADNAQLEAVGFHGTRGAITE